MYVVSPGSQRYGLKTESDFFTLNLIYDFKHFFPSQEQTSNYKLIIKSIEFILMHSFFNTIASPF